MEAAMQADIVLRPLLAALLCALAAPAALAQEPNLNGAWVCNQGKVRLIPPVTPGNRVMGIKQVGSQLTLVAEDGKQAAGQIVEADALTATDWQFGAQAYLGINVDGTFYRMHDAALARFKMPVDTVPNFIRWDGGMLCTKAPASK
jgi:hypothetical protein